MLAIPRRFPDNSLDDDDDDGDDDARTIIILFIEYKQRFKQYFLVNGSICSTFYSSDNASILTRAADQSNLHQTDKMTSNPIRPALSFWIQTADCVLIVRDRRLAPRSSAESGYRRSFLRVNKIRELQKFVGRVLFWPNEIVQLLASVPVVW